MALECEKQKQMDLVVQLHGTKDWRIDKGFVGDLLKSSSRTVDQADKDH